MSNTMGEAGERTLTTEPVVEVNETDWMGTLKLRKEAPAGGASVTVTAKLALPGGGGGGPPTGPLQELRPRRESARRLAGPKEKRFM